MFYLNFLFMKHKNSLILICCSAGLAAALILSSGCEKIPDPAQEEISYTVKRYTLTTFMDGITKTIVYEPVYDEFGRISFIRQDWIDYGSGIMPVNYTYEFSYFPDYCEVRTESYTPDLDERKSTAYRLYTNDKGWYTRKEYSDGSSLELVYDSEGQILDNGDRSFEWENGNILRSYSYESEDYCNFEYLDMDNPFYGETVDWFMMDIRTLLANGEWVLGFYGPHNRKLLKRLEFPGNIQQFSYTADRFGRPFSYTRCVTGTSHHYTGIIEYH